MPDLRDDISSALQDCDTAPLRESTVNLLATLGYRSDRTVKLADSSPQTFLDFIHTHATGANFNETKARCAEWKSADLLFQLTDSELSGQRDLFDETVVAPSQMQSYLFFAIELAGDNYARGKLTDIARQMNRVFPMPVMVLLRHKSQKLPVLSIAVINRRQHKRDAAKDVLGKVTIIRDISLAEPHRGHLDILASFALPNLVHPQRLPINSFDALHTAWEEIFNVELLNKRFYRELANWYFWALPQVEFPADTETDAEKRRATSLIRLLTRLIFCWFLKEKGLIPDSLFQQPELRDILKDIGPESCTYYQAILQNLFFATLNQRMGKDGKGRPYRKFAKNEGFQKNRSTYGIDNLFRYEDHFHDPDAALAHFDNVPFLNGGLFECLDRTDPQTKKKVYVDGFSRNNKKRPVVPNELFFGEERTVDLSDAYGQRKRRNERVRGLLRILNSYKFTIVENTPIDQEIALDPELLGKVFENLLASYNEETKTTARKQTGSFYTPRPIVEYMVDQSLLAYLATGLVGCGMGEADARTGLELLFTWSEQPHPFSDRQVEVLLEAIHACKILDPACGSGAFPMGMLQKLVYIIHKLDPDNARWKQLQIDKASEIPDSSARAVAIKAIEHDFADNEDDYGRKLYLIENCLYGVDIQPIAIQISKLRFFISLVCDQRTHGRKRDNLGIRPLPNLETKFVAADTLISLRKDPYRSLWESGAVQRLERDLQRVRHDHFAATTRQKKLALQNRDREIRDALAKELEQTAFYDQAVARKLANWDPFDPQASADYFEPLWMFDASLIDGFDIVLGNPPYGADIAERLRTDIQTHFQHQDYQLDTYLLFIERGCQLLREGGVQSLIIPNTWLPAIMFRSIRRFVFEHTTLLSLANIETDVFAAVVNNTILTHRNLTPRDDHVASIVRFDGEFHPYYLQRQAIWSAERGTPVSVSLTPQRREVALQIQTSTTLDKWFYITPGCKPYQTGKGTPKQTGDVVKSKPFTSTSRETGQFRPLLRGSLIARYQILWNDDLWIEFGEWLAEPRLSARYDAPTKIVMRQTGDSLIAALDERQFIVMNNMFSIVPKSDSAPTEFALAALNSTTMNWYYQNYINPERGEALAEVKKGHLTRLVLPENALEVNRAFSPIVRIAIACRSFAPSHRELFQYFSDLIDACVMECYFREHMAERDLLLLDDLAPHLEAYDATASESRQRKYIEDLYRTLNAADSPIRNRLLRLCADSPNLLAVIKNEGQK